ncbi:MAG: iron-containing redox enzyme family protein [Cyanobacteria bacterium P01_G01_bin.39]
MPYTDYINNDYPPREVYRILANWENNPENLWLAKYTGEQVFVCTQTSSDRKYSKESFADFRNKIYSEAVAHSRLPHWGNTGNLPDGRRGKPVSDAGIIEMQLQKAVSNSHDTAFLGSIGFTGPIKEWEAILHKIAFEERGAGNSKDNHNNLYLETISKYGITLLPIENYADDGRLKDFAFCDAALQLAIGRHPKHFMPEILGMAFALEWTGSPSAFRSKKLLKSRGLDTSFYDVHIVSDNPYKGHGRDIVRAIELYLDDVRETLGEEAMQYRWRRIHQCYHTWMVIDSYFEIQLIEHLLVFENTNTAA